MLLEEVTPEEIRRQLADILKSREFQNSVRLHDFLKFIVEESLAGRDTQLKAYTLATNVFKLGDSFDPAANPLIRVEAGRLRNKLDHYYLTHPQAPVRIAMPKGGYAPHFSRNTFLSPLENAIFEAKDASEPPIQAARGIATVLILPFTAINNTEEAARFIAGLVNELTIDLTKFTDLSVIGSPQSVSPFSERGTSAYANARFILSGSVEMSEKDLKIWVCLTDTSFGANVWAEKFCGSLAEATFSELQDKVAQSVSSRIADGFGLIKRALLHESAKKRVDQISPREAALFYYQWHTALTLDSFKTALAAIEQALDQEPDNTLVRAMLSDLYASDYHWSYGQVEDSLEKALPLAVQAVNADPGCQVAHQAAAFNYYLRQDLRMFMASAEKAIRLNPSNVSALTAISFWYGLSGEWEKSLQILNKAVALTPSPPPWYRANLSLYHYLQEDYNAAFVEAHKIMMPETLWDAMYRLISSGKLGLKKEAQLSKADLLKIYPDFECRGLTILNRNVCNKAYAEKIREGLAAGGVKFSTRK